MAAKKNTRPRDKSKSGQKMRVPVLFWSRATYSGMTDKERGDEMRHMIVQERTAVRDGAVGSILPYLPARLSAELMRCGEGAIEELRLRSGVRSCICTAAGVLSLETVLTAADMAQTLNALCGGSMYAHMQTLLDGYVTLSGGIRVGVCGRLQRHEGRELGLGEVTSLVFRFPRAIPVPTDDICRLLQRHPGRGVLLYAPPGGGKTTMLRALIRALGSAGSSRQVAVVDTREELAACGTAAAANVEWLYGYPRARGIGIATRTLGAHIIVCDEIGDADEADSICAACNAGVALVASAHAASVEGLLRRRGLRQLHAHGVFGSYVGLSRAAGQGITRRITSADDVGVL